MRNVMIKVGDENVLIYNVSPDVTNETLRDFFEMKTGIVIDDVYDVKEEEICYYIIDGRLSMTENDNNKIIGG